MKILAVIESYLPGRDGGGPVRALENLSAHLPENVELFILTRNYDYLGSEVYAQIPANEWFEEERYRICYATDAAWLSIYQAFIQAGKPDWIYLNGLFAPFTRKILGMQQGSGRIVLAPHGNLGPGALQKARLKKKIWLWLARNQGRLKQLRWHAGSDREAGQIRQHVDVNADIVVVPMAPEPRKDRGHSEPYRDDDSTGVLRLVYFGRLSREKNLVFALDCLRVFSERRPEVSITYDLYYIGTKCPDIEGQSKQLLPQVKVNFIPGLEPRILQERLCAMSSDTCPYDAMLMPSLSENFSYTVLESMQAGIPPLISDQTPWRDLEAKGIGWDLSLEEMEPWLNALQTLAACRSAEKADRRKSLFRFVDKWIEAYPEQLKELFR